MSGRRILEAALGTLLAGLLTRAGAKLGTGVGVVLLGIVGLAARWWQTQGLLVQLLIVCAVAAFLLRRPWLQWHARRRPRLSNAHLDDRPHWLYRWWSATGELLYVGISNDPARRYAQHLDDPRKPWARALGVTFEVEPEPYPGRAAVLLAERRAIEQERPRHNVVHNTRAGRW
jgi:predicted GIY-YIG superfamily endonuclease